MVTTERPAWVPSEVENELRIEPGYFPPASPQQQMEACRRTIANIQILNRSRKLDQENSQLYLSLGDVGEHIFGFADVMYQVIANHDERRMHRGEGEKMIASTVALLDKVLIDEISSTTSLDDSSRVRHRYYREFGLDYADYADVFDTQHDDSALDTIEDVAFVTPSEQKALLGYLADSAKYQLVDESVTITDREAGKIWVYPEQVTSAQLHAIASNLLHDNPSLIPFVLDVSVAGFFIQHGTSLDSISLDLPRSEMPRQEIYRALLRSGRELFPLGLDEQNKKRLDQEMQKLPADVLTEVAGEFCVSVVQGYARNAEGEYGNAQSSVDTSSDLKSQHWVKHIGNKDWWPQERLQFKNTHYKNVFGRTHEIYGEPELRLTRSGVSANETAIRMAAATVASIGKQILLLKKRLM